MGKIYIIVNPAAGTEEPVHDYIKEIMAGTNYEVKTAEGAGHIEKLARELKEDAACIAVYGGDGSVCEAAKALHGSNTPFAIIPGGTANVMAKELELPLDTKDALTMLANNAYTVKAIDMGLVNGCPFLLRVNLGILADMITETSEDMKERWGQFAYGITAFKEIPSEGVVYKLVIDGQEFTQQAVALTVTNAGNIGKKGYSFLPGISVEDGLLDVILLDKVNILSALQVAGNILFHSEASNLRHWKAKNISIKMEGTNHYLCDDGEQFAQQLDISVSPASLNAIIPAS